jgi:hypothetical protein
VEVDLSNGSYYLVSWLLAVSMAQGGGGRVDKEGVPAAPHARASGRARRDKVRVGRIHIVVNVRCMIERLLYEVCMGAWDG